MLTQANTESPIKPNYKMWKEDGALKILTIGNSFSVDSMKYVYQIAKAAGIENIELGNLYISGCSLAMHLNKARNDLPAYTYYTNNNGEWHENLSFKLADAVKSNNWDFISFQQASAKSGLVDSYDDLNALMDIVKPLCTNENVKFVWHMTWAYQSDSTHSGFATYNNNQNTMYSDIISAVQQKIVSNERIVKVIPNGTAVQNARTSYIGDSLTRDGYHMSYAQGRVLTGVTMVAALAGIDYWDNLDISSISGDTLFNKVVFESVKNAIYNPFEITQSKFADLENLIDRSN